MNITRLLRNAFNRTLKIQRWVAFGSFAVITLGSSALSAIQPETYLDVYGGYRLDRFTSLYKTFGTPPLEFLRGEREEEFLFSDKIKVKRLGIWVAGGKAQIRFCDYFFLKGYGQYGWIDRGDYHQERKDRHCEESHSASKFHDERCRDGSIGFGYLYPIRGYWGCMGIGPVIGYGYNDQLFRMGSFITDGFEDPILEKLSYKTRWSGPWLGLDYVYELCGFKLMSSLEYHWVTWHGEWRLHWNDIFGVAFSKRFKSTNAHGVVWSFDGQWNFWDMWHIGLEYKWQFWDAHGGDAKPKHCNYKNLGFPWIEEMKVKHTRWYSDTLTMYIGFDW